jgi:hypothetical protein
LRRHGVSGKYLGGLSDCGHPGSCALKALSNVQ